MCALFKWIRFKCADQIAPLSFKQFKLRPALAMTHQLKAYLTSEITRAFLGTAYAIRLMVSHITSFSQVVTHNTAESTGTWKFEFILDLKCLAQSGHMQTRYGFWKIVSKNFDFSKISAKFCHQLICWQAQSFNLVRFQHYLLDFLTWFLGAEIYLTNELEHQNAMNFIASLSFNRCCRYDEIGRSKQIAMSLVEAQVSQCTKRCSAV